MKSLFRWKYCLVSGDVSDAVAIVKKICICLRQLVYARATPRFAERLVCLAVIAILSVDGSGNKVELDVAGMVTVTVCV